MIGRLEILLALGGALTLGSCASSDTTDSSAPIAGSVEKPATPSRHSRSTAGTWAIQYEGPIVVRDREYHVVDLFDVSSSDLAKIRNAGSKPIAYFSSQYESWRKDAEKFPEEALGNSLDGWAGEKWIDTGNTRARAIMTERLDYAKARGFWGVDVDNVDGYLHQTGFATSRGDAADYVRFLAREAHNRGLKFGLKNATDLVPKVKRNVDFFVNEQAIQYDEAYVYRFVGKPVLNIEYNSPRESPSWMFTVVKRIDVGVWEKLAP